MSYAFRTDAGADRVEAWLGSRHGDLRPQARLTRDRADLDGPGFDLRHLGLEQAVHERACRARDANLRLPRIVLGLEDHDQHRLAWVQLLSRNLLLRRHDSLDASQVDEHSAGLDAVD